MSFFHKNLFICLLEVWGFLAFTDTVNLFSSKSESCWFLISLANTWFTLRKKSKNSNFSWNTWNKWVPYRLNCYKVAPQCWGRINQDQLWKWRFLSLHFSLISTPVLLILLHLNGWVWSLLSLCTWVWCIT